MLYRYRRFMVEAFAFGNDDEPLWFKIMRREGLVHDYYDTVYPIAVIQTPGGDKMVAKPGDYIFRDFYDNLYTMPRDIFEKYYEKA